MLEIERTKASVTIDDVQLIRKSIFEIRDISRETDEYLRQTLAAKVELHATKLEDCDTLLSNLNSKYS